MYQFNGRQLITENGTLFFPYDIREIVEMGDILILRLALLGQEDDSNQVYGVKDGEVIWRVDDRIPNRSWYNELQDEPYTGIDPYNKNPNLIIGVVGSGARYLIDPTNGKIVGTESWVK